MTTPPPPPSSSADSYDMQVNRQDWKEAIAYRRVSTPGQAESGIGFEGQRAAIERYAGLRKLRIVSSYQDVGSGRGRRNLLDRPGLQAAIDEAVATGLPIVVSSLDRLSRDADTINEIAGKYRVTIISAGDGKMRDPVILASEAARAQREGELNSQRTKDALARKKAEGVVLGNQKNLPEARLRAAERKKEIAEQTVKQIVAVLDDLAGKVVTDRQLVDILNQRGILTSTKRLWTVAAIRRPVRAARASIKEREAQVLERQKKNPNWGRF